MRYRGALAVNEWLSASPAIASEIAKENLDTMSRGYGLTSLNGSDLLSSIQKTKLVIG